MSKKIKIACSGTAWDETADTLGGCSCTCHASAQPAPAPPDHEDAAGAVEGQGACTVNGSTSDGFHTFDELYAYRQVYNAALVNEWAASDRYPVVKSWKHSDGELAFGGGWFIVVATLPTGQISNHYEADAWDEFQVPAVDLPPEYDGHTPAEALDRLRALTALPAATTPAPGADLRERIARVLCAQDYDGHLHEWDFLTSQTRDRYRADADAVLAVVQPMIGLPGFQDFLECTTELVERAERAEAQLARVRALVQKAHDSDYTNGPTYVETHLVRDALDDTTEKEDGR